MVPSEQAPNPSPPESDKPAGNVPLPHDQPNQGEPETEGQVADRLEQGKAQQARDNANKVHDEATEAEKVFGTGRSAADVGSGDSAKGSIGR